MPVRFQVLSCSERSMIVVLSCIVAMSIEHAPADKIFKFCSNEGVRGEEQQQYHALQ